MIWQDFRFAARAFVRTPVFTATALLTLTLTIGATIAIFGLLNALLLRRLPVRDPQQLVQLSTSTPLSRYKNGVTFSQFERISGRRDLFSNVLGWLGPGVFNVDVQRQQGLRAISFVSGGFLKGVGVAPAVGRDLGPSDTDPLTLEPAPVAVISFRLWQSHFSGNPDVLGSRIRIDDREFTIVGVAPPKFTALGLTIEPDVLLPLTWYPVLSGSTASNLRNSASFWVLITARLQPEITIDQARAALNAEWPSLKDATLPGGQTTAQRDRFLSARLLVESAATGVERELRDSFSQPLVALFGIAGLIMLIACLNLASLMLARAGARSHEIGVRVALGASRWQIVRQMLIEGVFLSVVGGALGLNLAVWVGQGIVHAMLRDSLVPAWLDVGVDAHLLAFATAASIGAGVMFSIIPGLRSTRLSTIALLRSGSRTASAVSRPGRLLVGAQIAMSLVLLANAGLLVRTLQQIRAVDSGLHADDILVAYPLPEPGAYAQTNNDVYYPELVESLQRVPGVTRAAVSLSRPAGGGVGGGERVSRVRAPSGDDDITSLLIAASPGLLDVLRISLRSGRDFSWDDDSHTRRVAIVSETLARRLFPHGAVGEHIRVGTASPRQDLEIIGIVDDAHLYDLRDPNLAAVYLPALQQSDPNGKCLVLRAKGVSVEALNGAIGSLGRERIARMETLADIAEGAVLQERLTAGIAAFFGMVALMLAGVGLYGLISYTVHQRHREIGIRMALGAEPRRILAAVVREAAALALAGIVIGFAGALLTKGAVRSLLFGVTPDDPVTFIGAIGFLMVAALTGALVPALRAAKVDPVTALRSE
jgi:putative ABC transport system permease protein